MFLRQVTKNLTSEAFIPETSSSPAETFSWSDMVEAVEFVVLCAEL